MSSTSAGPSTIDGIKRLAKTIKRERNIPHHQALDLAARAAGFENIRHAQDRLDHGPLPAASRGHSVYLTCYWATRGARGREVLQLQLSKPLAVLLTPSQVRRARNLGSFRFEFEDHLEREVDLDTQAGARNELFAVSRTLKFLAATGLRPTTTRTQEKAFSRFQSLPGRDHPSHWWDPATSAWVYLDEPYHANVEQRLEWAHQAGVQMIVPEWEGLYAPGMSAPYLFCENSGTAARLNTLLANLPKNAGTQESPKWTGESGNYFEPFISPARAMAGKSRKLRPRPATPGVERAGALPYGANRGGMTSRWRPAVRMPLEQHLIVGPLLHALGNSEIPAVALRAITEVRATLDGWLQMEFPGEEMSADQFHQAYYGTWRAPIPERRLQLDCLNRVERLLQQGYNDCAPRRQLLKLLGQAKDKLRQ